MQTIVLILIIEIFNILIFYIGAKTAQQIQNNEIIHLPNPIRKIEEYKEKNEDKKINEINMENINNYDGSPIGQKDIPN